MAFVPEVFGLNTLSGNVVLTSDNASFVSSQINRTINMTLGATGVTSLNDLSGNVSITSPDSSVGVSTLGQSIRLNVNELNSLNGIQNVATLNSSDSSIGISYPSPNAIGLSAQPLHKVVSLNTVQGVANLTSPDNSVGITRNGQNIELSIVIPPSTLPSLFTTAAANTFVWVYQNLDIQRIYTNPELGSGTFFQWPTTVQECALYPNRMSNRDLPTSQPFQWYAPITGTYQIVFQYAQFNDVNSVATDGIVGIVNGAGPADARQVFQNATRLLQSYTFTISMIGGEITTPITGDYLLFCGGTVSYAFPQNIQPTLLTISLVAAQS